MFSPFSLTSTQSECFSNLSFKSLISFLENLVCCTLVLIINDLFFQTFMMSYAAFALPSISICFLCVVVIIGDTKLFPLGIGGFDLLLLLYRKILDFPPIQNAISYVYYDANLLKFPF